MRQGFVINERDGRRVPVERAIVIGRTVDCALSIDDTAASRRHVEIVDREDSFVWKDLGSTNGTYLNGQKMLAGELGHGDVITIGETHLRFEVVDLPASENGGDLADSTVFRGTIIGPGGQDQTPPAPDKSAVLLETVYSVVNAISANYDRDELIERILATTLTAVNAKRGAILLQGLGERLLHADDSAVYFMEGRTLRTIAREELKVSNTVVNRVMNGGESVLYQDTDGDEELSEAASIVALELRSIICVPLRAKNGILGILYIDTDEPGRAYSREDLLLATAVGNSAGLALENAQMHQAILDKQRIEQEISTAWSIQEGFLVQQWQQEDPRFAVYGETRPAKTVGGDFYDFLRPHPDRVGVLIGDVSGKGVPASLTMAQLLAEFRLHARAETSPAAVLARLNDSMVQRARYGMFCTVYYLVIDLQTGALTAANAGHHPALHIAGEVRSFGEPSGPPIGVVADFTWSDTTTQLGVNDLVLLYTDGLVEARQGRGERETGSGMPAEEYGEGRLGATAGRCCGAGPNSLIQALYEDVRDFCSPDSPHDDCTTIAVQFLGGA